MDYLQTLFGFFNAPLFATFILGMFWKRMTSDRGLGRSGRRNPFCGLRFHPRRGLGCINLPGQGVPFMRGIGGVRRRHHQSAWRSPW